jgi:hypothetical protein
VKKLKLVILSCGVVGLAALLVPFGGRSLLVDYFALDVAGALVHTAIFVLPLVMAAIALARPPMQSWQPGVALAGFVLGVVRLRVWETPLHAGDMTGAEALVFVALVAGTVAALAALWRPEAPE